MYRKRGEKGREEFAPLIPILGFLEAIFHREFHEYVAGYQCVALIFNLQRALFPFDERLHMDVYDWKIVFAVVK